MQFFQRFLIFAFVSTITFQAFSQPQGDGGDPSAFISVGGSSGHNSPFGKVKFPTIGLGVEFNNNEKVSYTVGGKYSEIELSNLQYSLKNLRVPFIVHFNPSHLIHFNLGVEGSYLLSGKDAKGAALSKDVLKPTSIGGVLGLETGFKNRGPLFGVEYTRRGGLKNDKNGYGTLDVYVRLKLGPKERPKKK